MKKSVVLFAALLLTACMGKSQDLQPEENPDDAQMAAFKSSLPVCRSRNDIIICDWGKDEGDSVSAHPVISTLLPTKLTSSLLDQ